MADDPLQHLDLAGAVKFRRSLTPETDRGCALLAAAYLDTKLESLLSSHFVDEPKIIAGILGQSRPLGTFSSRIDLCYVLGLISVKTRQDLHLIRKIRNDFAHVPEPITFENGPIANRCRELYHDGLQHTESPRDRFTRVVLGVLGVVEGTILKSAHAQPPIDIGMTTDRIVRIQAYQEQAFSEVQELFTELQADTSITDPDQIETIITTKLIEISRRVLKDMLNPDDGLGQQSESE